MPAPGSAAATNAVSVLIGNLLGACPAAAYFRAGYSTPTLLRLLASHHIDAGQFVTHHFALEEIDKAYDVFARPADTGALKVLLSRTV